MLLTQTSHFRDLLILSKELCMQFYIPITAFSELRQTVKLDYSHLSKFFESWPNVKSRKISFIYRDSVLLDSKWQGRLHSALNNRGKDILLAQVERKAEILFGQKVLVTKGFLFEDLKKDQKFLNIINGQ